MITTVELTNLLSEVTGWPRHDIAMRTRYLIPSGLLPRGGRGLNAPHLDDHHIAAMIIATLVGGVQTDAPKLVRSVGSLTACGVWIEKFGDIGPIVRRSTQSNESKATECQNIFPDGITFIEAIYNILNILRTGDKKGSFIGSIGGAIGTMEIAGGVYGLVLLNVIGDWSTGKQMQIDFGQDVWPEILAKSEKDHSLISRITMIPRPALVRIAEATRQGENHD